MIGTCTPPTYSILRSKNRKARDPWDMAKIAETETQDGKKWPLSLQKNNRAALDIDVHTRPTIKHNIINI